MHAASRRRQAVTRTRILSRSLTSIRNPRVQSARKLRRKQGRDEESAFLAEGPTVIQDALTAGAEIRDVFVEEGDAENLELQTALSERDIPVWTVARDVIGALTETVTPRGIVAVVSDPTIGLEALNGVRLALVLADVRDPGNAGTLVRSALAAGAGAVVFAKGSVDPLHPKVVRSAAGSIFQIPIVRGPRLQDVAEVLGGSGVALVGTAADAPTDMYDADLTRPMAIVLGNEAWGLPPDATDLMDLTVRIPMPGPAESLNVSVAGSILLFEALRQRRASGSPGRDAKAKAGSPRRDAKAKAGSPRRDAKAKGEGPPPEAPGLSSALND